jgi:hypothetical protein
LTFALGLTLGLTFIFAIAAVLALALTAAVISVGSAAWAGTSAKQTISGKRINFQFDIMPSRNWSEWSEAGSNLDQSPADLLGSPTQ